MKDFPNFHTLQFQITEKRITEQQVGCERSMNIPSFMQISRSRRRSAVCLGSSVQDKRFMSLADYDLHRKSQRDAQVSEFQVSVFPKKKKKKKKKCNVEAHCDVDTFKLSSLCQCSRIKSEGGTGLKHIYTCTNTVHLHQLLQWPQLRATPRHSRW